MQNNQPIEKIDHTDMNTHLSVVKIWRTIQGEGPFAGCRAVFVRLAGCNLQCPLCDTDYTSSRGHWSLSQIAHQIKYLDDSPFPLVVLTGGEPFRQNISYFCSYLSDIGMRVQVETNGTIFRPEFPYDRCTIVCSPKTGKIHPGLIPHIKAFKYVLEHGQVDPEDGLPLSVLGNKIKVARPPAESHVDVYVQPLDVQDPELNKKNVGTAVGMCLKHGYRLCLQVHKLVGLE